MEHVKFWKDKWLGNFTLQETFPTLFHLATNPNSTVAHNRSNNTWEVLFRRNIQDWEIEEVLDLLGRLANCTVSIQHTDNLRWGTSKEGAYTVKAGYNKLCALNEVIDMWPWKLIWKTKMPTKVSCFAWTTLKGAILTQDNLCRRSFQIVNRCHMCKLNSESINHLFLHCTVAIDLWHMFFSIFGISWTLPQNIKEAVESWSFWKVSKAIKSIWKMVPGVSLEGSKEKVIKSTYNEKAFEIMNFAMENEKWVRKIELEPMPPTQFAGSTARYYFLVVACKGNYTSNKASPAASNPITSSTGDSDPE
uniref:Uncharacterized protein LOC104237089 n=1 Tax=Nicotiana sylvestris TaxID=4096 RepID=A0A1U7XSJ8_NICSY|nr:PREDICTED: uncharacterized protein LOC104237089 [Nicotiana sylvestris]